MLACLFIEREQKSDRKTPKKIQKPVSVLCIISLRLVIEINAFLDADTLACGSTLTSEQEKGKYPHILPCTIVRYLQLTPHRYSPSPMVGKKYMESLPSLHAIQLGMGKRAVTSLAKPCLVLFSQLRSGRTFYAYVCMCMCMYLRLRASFMLYTTLHC